MELENEINGSQLIKHNEKKVLDMIRRKKYVSSKNELSDLTKLPWSSVSNILKVLTEKRMINVSQSTEKKTEETYSINPEYGYFVGVSFGTSRIKLIVLDYSFSTVKINNSNFSKWALQEKENNDKEVNEYIELAVEYMEKNLSELKVCFDKQCSKLTDIIPIITAITRILSYLKLKEKLNVLSINFVFPGTIDNEHKIILSSYILEKMYNVNIDKLLSRQNVETLENNEIKYYIDHNVKAAIVAEKEIGGVWNSINEDKNLMCIYLGYGIGSAFYLNNELYRGNRNESGQLGHTQVIPRESSNLKIKDDVDDSVCRCGKENCLEHRIRNDIFSNDNNFDFKTATIESVQNILNSNRNKIKLLAKYLCEAIDNTLANLSIDKIVLSGKFSGLFETIENELNEYLILNNMSNVELNKSNLGEFSAAYGAAIMAYHNFYDTEDDKS